MERIGVYICHCGTNIAGSVDVEEVTNFISTLDGVAAARHYSYSWRGIGSGSEGSRRRLSANAGENH